MRDAARSAAGSPARPNGTCIQVSLFTTCAISGPTPPSCAWPNASSVPASARNLPSAFFSAFRHDDRAIADAFDRRLHRRRNLASSNGHFGKQDDVRRIVGALAGQPGGGGDPARVTAHHFHHEHLGRRFAHRRHVETRFEHRHRGVFGDRAEARAAIGDRQVVVHRLGHADHLQRIAGDLPICEIFSEVSAESLPPL